MDIFSRLKSGLSKTRLQISSIIKGAEFDDTFFDSLEEALIAADLGLDLSVDVIDRLREDISQKGITEAADAIESLKEILVSDLHAEKVPEEFPPKPWVILIVGVNGVGKTTTIGKISNELRNNGKKVILGAADTFRAGAIEQLRIWAQRTGCDFVSQHERADAASVSFDSIEAAKSRSSDVLILDTAGRLHNKVNLMKELEKIVRVIKKNTPHAPNEILLVVDATTGQNAIKQAQVFNDIVPLTGLVITKLDGTAKGGVALALTKKLGVPIRKIGVGEGIDDLQDFDPHAYVEAMLGDIV
ncbi:signal recognition particle-docking protein FtsY [Chitinispirillales bacterium ANBcel5]|uniref:signal recognition particle-docking protein FtsY n=1 Tax=Cellulosispirillum alkaliphilum TaxID=3039283 RepID=UPI002A52674D|nr:signal recognition particle-docking protein FtsY [Chitinispirillales bacterium ANBcel5]